MKNSRSISRRTALRGVLAGLGVQVVLPLFESALNANGDAYADETPLPKKFGVWFFGDGVRPNRWVPTKTGLNWPVSDELEPLSYAALKPYVSVISGMNAMGNPYVHSGPASAVLTGTGLLHATGDGGTPEGPSIDILLKDLLPETPFGHIESGLYHFLGNGSAYTAISHNGPDSPNYPEDDARKMFNRLFGDGSPGATRASTAPPVVDYTNVYRRSVLDAVLAECSDVQRKLGAADKKRLEQHCESIRSLERRLAPLPPSAVECLMPAYPSGITDDKAGFKLYDSSQYFREINLAMAELHAYAAVCDLAHVFTHCFTNPASHWQFDPAMVGASGSSGSFHVLTHDEPGDQPTVHAGVVFQMTCLADFLEVFRTTPFGPGNLLDQSAIMATSDCAIGQNHSPNDMPFLMIGKAGGLKGNYHHRSSGESVTRGTLTIAQAVVGEKLASFGTGEQLVESRYNELFI